MFGLMRRRLGKEVFPPGAAFWPLAANWPEQTNWPEPTLAATCL
jgi:hypothetical protein